MIRVLLHPEIIAVGRTNVKKENRCKYLGVTIDKHLSFDLQVKQVLQKMAMGIKTIDAIKNPTSNNTYTASTTSCLYSLKLSRTFITICIRSFF